MSASIDNNEPVLVCPVCFGRYAGGSSLYVKLQTRAQWSGKEDEPAIVSDPVTMYPIGDMVQIHCPCGWCGSRGELQLLVQKKFCLSFSVTRNYDVVVELPVAADANLGAVYDQLKSGNIDWRVAVDNQYSKHGLELHGEEENCQLLDLDTAEE